MREAGLPARDHGIRQMYFGGVGAAYRREDGLLQAAGDPRREAAVDVVDVPTRDDRLSRAQLGSGSRR